VEKTNGIKGTKMKKSDTGKVKGDVSVGKVNGTPVGLLANNPRRERLG